MNNSTIPKPQFHLQIYDINDGYTYSKLIKEIELFEPRIPLKYLNENVYIRMFIIIYQDGKIWSYDPYDGLLMFSKGD